MAGAGSGFRSRGYLVPKHMILARGKTLFEWSLESLRPFFDHHFIFACLLEHDGLWVEAQARAMGIKYVTVVKRRAISLGQAHTVHDVLNRAVPNDPIWIYSIDTYIRRGLAPCCLLGHQGCVPVFKSIDPGMSFVRYDEDGEVIELAEKNVISNWATVGLYGFQSASLYRELYQQSYCNGIVSEAHGERYVAPMYQLLLQAGMSISAPQLNGGDVHVLGSPAEVLAFDSNCMPPFGSQTPSG